MDEWETDSDSSNEEEKSLEDEKTVEDEAKRLGSAISKASICKWIYYIDNGVLDTAEYNNNTLDVVDDRIYEHGKTNDVVYKIGLDLVDASYTIPIDLFKDSEAVVTVKSVIERMVRTMQLTYDYVVNMMNRKSPDLIFEPQTMTFYNHYNDRYRIGITVKKIPLSEYDRTNVY